VRYLLDTHTFLWLASDDPRLSSRAREVFLNEESEILLSIASVWELAIKASLGRLAFMLPLPQFIEQQIDAMGLQLLPIALQHVLAVETLPFHHRDPFDRLLIAQSTCERAVVLGTDEAFDAYGVERVW
jgi:PIN domain nuclease of toxin-antitoxin system